MNKRLPLNPLELLKSAVSSLDTIPGEFGEEHANVLQLEAASVLVLTRDVQDGSDKAVVILGESRDRAMQHISICEVCMRGMEQFLILH